MKSDRERWEQRYGESVTDALDPDPLLVQVIAQLGHGRALDLACGRGANALFLAQHGFQVDAVDISLTALRSLRTAAFLRGADIACIQADLNCFPLPKAVYDVVIVFYFYSQALIKPIKETLKPGGTLCYVTYNVRHTTVKPGFNPAYLIKPNYLAFAFSDFDIILHESESGPSGNVSRLTARRSYGNW